MTFINSTKDLKTYVGAPVHGGQVACSIKPSCQPYSHLSHTAHTQTLWWDETVSYWCTSSQWIREQHWQIEDWGFEEIHSVRKNMSCFLFTFTVSHEKVHYNSTVMNMNNNASYLAFCHSFLSIHTFVNCIPFNTTADKQHWPSKRTHAFI